MENLPIELQWNIMKFMRHPTADLISQAIEEHEQFLHIMAKHNHITYDVISVDPDFVFHQYLHHEYICKNMSDIYITNIYN